MGIDLRDVDQPIGTLSGGERQCVAIARAVYFGARVLILDEPTAALGVRQSGVVLKYIAKARDRGLGVIFITHNPHHAYPVGDRFMLLRRGRSMGDFPKAEMTLDELVADDGRRRRARGAEPRARPARCRTPTSPRRWRRRSRPSRPRPSTRSTAKQAARDGDPCSASGSSGSAGWVRCTHGPGPGCSSTTRTLRCGRGSWPWRTPTRRQRETGALTAYGFDAARTPTGASCSRATTSTWSACAVPTSCTARSASRSPSRASTSGSRSRPGGTVADTAEIAEAVDAAGRAVGGRLQLPQRPGGRAGPRAGRVRSARDGRDGRRPPARRLRRPPGRRRCRGASTPSSPAPACSVTWPATASTWRRTSVGRRSAGSPSWSPTRRRSSPSVPSVERRGLALLDARRRRARARSATRTRSSALLRFAVGCARLRSSRSRVAVGEQCTLRHRGARHRGALSRGTSAGWASSRSASTRTTRTRPGRRVSSTPATASSLPSSRAAGIAMGYDDLKVIEAERLVRSIASGKPHRRHHRRRRGHRRAGRRDGAVVRAERRWVSL